MNKRQARIFAIGSTVVAALAFLGLTIDSHRQFPKLTNAQNITPAVTHGKDVWPTARQSDLRRKPSTVRLTISSLILPMVVG